MRILLVLFTCALMQNIKAQVPQGISYQGVAIDSQGFELSNQSISVRASILSGAVNGEVQWQETHATSTDDFGLFALTIGEGANTGGGQLASFSDIPWGDNTFFLQIEMDASGGNDYILMGVNQMMSVPYALYAENTSITYESIANYLLQDFTFIENITNVLSDSLANAIAVDSLFICNVVTNLNNGGCDSLLIEGPNDGVWACGDSIEYWDYEYATVQIGTACWFAKNLRTTVYRNGDSIPADFTDSQWPFVQGATAVYGEGSSPCYNNSPDIDACDDAQSLAEYGRLYNWYAVDDCRGLCPSGWHVPTVGDWAELEAFITAQGFTGTEGTALKSTSGWYDSGNGTDYLGFSALPGGFRDGVSGDFQQAGFGGEWWSSSPNVDPGDNAHAYSRRLEHNSSVLLDYSRDKEYGFSIRCLAD